MADLRAIFDRVAGGYRPYEESPIHLRLKRQVLAAIAEHVAPGGSILDAGSGPGTYALPLAKLGYRVTAVDLAPRMLERLELDAREQGCTVATFCLDAKSELGALPMHDAAISIQGPLSYDADPLPIVRHIASRVHQGGLLVFAFARAASVEQLVRRPRMALAPFFSSAPFASRGTLAGEELEVYLHDARRLGRQLDTEIEVLARRAIGISTTLPEPADAALGRLPLLRRLGATSLFIGRVRER